MNTLFILLAAIALGLWTIPAGRKQADGWRDWADFGDGDLEGGTDNVRQKGAHHVTSKLFTISSRRMAMMNLESSTQKETIQ